MVAHIFVLAGDLSLWGYGLGQEGGDRPLPSIFRGSIKS